MNRRRVQELMRRQFPPVETAKHDWVNIADNAGPVLSLIRTVLEENIGSAEVLVSIHSKEGAFLRVAEAVTYIASHIGQGYIRVADREFKSVVVIAPNGVATGWRVGT